MQSVEAVRSERCRNFTTATLSLDLLDRGHRHVRWYSPQRKSYRVSNGNGLLNLRRRDAKTHGHRGHEARNLAVGEHEHAELREDRADDAVDRPLALDAALGRGLRLGQLPLEPPDAQAPEGVAPTHTDDERHVDHEHGLPGPHQCTCSSGGASPAVFSSLSCWTWATSASRSIASPLLRVMART